MDGTRLKIWAVLVVAVILGSIQGQRIEVLKEKEAFYRWAVAAGNAMYLGDTLEPDKSADIAEAQDDELFAELSKLADPLLSDVPEDPDGKDVSPLVRAVRQEQDKRIYAIVASSEASSVRKSFLKHRNAKVLQTLGTQFSTASLYTEGGQTEGVGLTSLFFGFRKLAANFLWMQVDTFWHAGEVHRILPMMKTCVTLDPNFIDAYQIGSWHLAYNLTAKMEDTPEPEKFYDEGLGARVGHKERWYYIAADFLKDGIRKNPRDYRLYFDLGYMIYMDKIRDYDNAVRYLDEARHHAHDKWVPRMLYRAQWLNGQYEDALEGWEDYLEDYPGDGNAIRFSTISRGFLAEARYEEAVLCMYRAKQAMDLAIAEGRSADAEKARSAIIEMEKIASEESKKAGETWQGMMDAGGDPVAESRISRRRTLDMVSEGRYFEAIAELDISRYGFGEFFQEGSDMMIAIKQSAGIGLNVSEREEVRRREDAKRYREERSVRRYLECDYLTENDRITFLDMVLEQSEESA